MSDLVPAQVYLNEIVEKFNANPSDPTLTDTERVLLMKVREVEEQLANLQKEVDALNAEIKERQQKGDQLVQQMLHKRGQSQAFIDSILALRKG